MDFPLMVRGSLVIIDAAMPRYCSESTEFIDLDLTVADGNRGTVQIVFTATPGDSEEHGRLLYDYALSLGPAPYVPDIESRKQLIAQSRYEAEVSGIIFNGVKVDSGRDSQGLITGATLASVLDPSYVCHWKTAEGFVELNAAALAAVSQAMRSHVQACFDRERVLLNALEAGTFNTAMLKVGWPSYE